MNSFQLSSLSKNPFTRPAFWGRQNELRTICKYLLSEPPQCCAIIGETYMGKTSLLRQLSDPQSPLVLDDLKIKDKFTFVYFDCFLYIELAKWGTYASAQFWWDLYSETQIRMKLDKPLTLPKPRINEEQALLTDTALEIKSELEGLIRSHPHPVVFVLDDFEGIACLPLRDSVWLRSIAQLNCVYIVASRHSLYLLYQHYPESWVNSSPLWNLFSDPLYLGLMAEDEVEGFLLQAKEEAGKLESCWEQEDLDFIKKMSGRHPELIRIACAHLFEQRLQSRQPLESDEYEFLKFSIYRAASPICNQLWYGLADPELWDVPGVAGYQKEKETGVLSPYQEALIHITKGQNISEKNILFVLEQRGLIEAEGGKWRVFAEVMRQFVLKQEQVRKSLGLTLSNKLEIPDNTALMPDERTNEPTRESQQSSDISPVRGATQAGSTIERPEAPAFTYLEGQIYDYLRAHTGEVCDREEIKWAVWGNNEPTNSALQKIIERIREKIEPDPKNPRYLIAVRGQGYMLRED